MEATMKAIEFSKQIWVVVVMTALLLMVGSAFADCTYNGSTYVEGTVIGPYTCTNGQWVSS
jgi:hypothetical protein